MTSERYIIPERVANWTSSMKGPTGRHLCKWCRKEVQKPRRYWCSQACIEEMIVRSGSPRGLAWKRDQGVCANCGFDCDKLERVAWYCWNKRRRRNNWLNALCEKYPWALQVRIGGLNINHIWEADHELPVIEGGGGCGMDNIRTLCIPCHRGETKKLHKRLSDKRAGRQTLPGLE